MKDELLEQAKEWSRKQGFVSVSYLQRIMRIGYTRAARLVDYMIEDGFCQNEYMAGTGHRQIIEAVEDSVQSDASPVEFCEHGSRKGDCSVVICSFNRYGERR